MELERERNSKKGKVDETVKIFESRNLEQVLNKPHIERQDHPKPAGS